MSEFANHSATKTVANRHESSNQKKKSSSFFAPAYIQPKLTIGAVDDPYEREADAMADQVMRMPAQQNTTPNFTDNKNSFFSPKPISTFNVQRECATCGKEKLKRKEEKPEEEKNVIHRKEKSFDGGLNNIDNNVQRKCAHCEEEEEKLQMKSEDGAGGGMEAPSIVHDVINSGGQTLDTGTRNFFEPRFGHDFSNVKIHTGSQASASSRAINAHAYTSGNNIVFNEGKFAPDTLDGKRLLAHELTHVVQQNETSLIQKQDLDAGVPSNQPLEGGQAPIEIIFEGRRLQNISSNIRSNLEEYIIANGENETSSFIDRFNNHVSISEHNLPDISGVTEESQRLSAELPLMRNVLNLLRNEFNQLKTENDLWLQNFENQEKTAIRDLLQNSEDRINAERIRYGITETMIERIRTTFHAGSDTEIQHTEQVVQYGIGNNAAVQEMAAGARLLARFRNDMQSLQNRQNSLVHTRCSTHTDICVDHISNQNEYDQLTLEISDKDRNYQILKSDLESRYPVLATFANDTGNLEQLGKGQTPETAAIIGQQICEKLGKIEEVRRELDSPNSQQVWKLPDIVRSTKESLNVTADSMHSRVIDDKVSEILKDDIIIGIFLAVLNLALIVAAPATGGVSLIVAAGITVGSTIQHLRQYQLEQAMSGTDFDKAKAVSQEEPSLFWLALDIVGAIADVAQALSAAIRVFRSLSPLAREIRLARTAEEAEQIIQSAEKTALLEGGQNGQALAQRVRNSMKKIQSSGSLERAIAGDTEEVRTLEHVAETIGREALEERNVLASVQSLSGRVRVTSAGRIFTCASPCLEIREKFAEFLMRFPDLERKLVTAETKASEASRLIESADPVLRQRGRDLAKQASSEAVEVANEAERDLLSRTSFEGLVDTESLGNDPWWADRLSHAREFDIGGYKSLTGRGGLGRTGDMLDSDEALQNLFLRERLIVTRNSSLIRNNPAVALSPQIHQLIRNLKSANLPGLSATEVLMHHIGEMRRTGKIPNDVIVIIERESLKYIREMGL